MNVRVGIGDFSRMTHLSIKALRHYHDVGVLVPAAVDPSSGYRSYDLDQVSVAHVIRRFRDLGMPVEEVRAVLSAPDVASRTELVTKHLARMRAQLLRTESVVSSLRSLLDSAPGTIPVEHRSVPATLGLAIAEPVAAADLDQWWGDAFDEIRSRLRRAGVEPSGPAGALYPAEYFQLEAAEVVAFIPVAQPVTGTRRARVLDVPGGEFAVAVHEGSLAEIDRTYAALGGHVVQRALGIEGPIREYYLVTASETPDESQHRTDVCWPIFRILTT